MKIIKDFLASIKRHNENLDKSYRSPQADVPVAEAVKRDEPGIPQEATQEPVDKEAEYRDCMGTDK